MVRDHQTSSEVKETITNLPQAQIAGVEIFNRMRVVKTLITDKDVLNKLKEKEVERENISASSSKIVTDHTLFTDTPWNIPYDMSEETVADGIKWFNYLDKSLEGDLSYIPIYIEEFERQLVSITEYTDLSIPFEQLAISLVTEQTFSQLVVNDGGLPQGLNKSVANHQKFTNFIVGLALEFKRIYDESALTQVQTIEK